MEVAACERGELTIGGMVDGLHADDARFELQVVRVHVLQEVQLGGGGTDDEDLVRPVEREGNLAKEPLRVIGVVLLRGVVVGVTPDVVARRVERRLVESIALDVEDARFVMVEPDRYVMIRRRCHLDCPVCKGLTRTVAARSAMILPLARKPCARVQSLRHILLGPTGTRIAPGASMQASSALSATPVREHASKTLVSVRPEALLAEVQDLMLEHDISAVPVIDERGEMQGILSTTDIVREAGAGASDPFARARISPPPRCARDLMRRDVISVDENAPLAEAASKMTAYRIHRVVVLRAGAPVAVLSTRDAVRAMMAHRIDIPLARVMSSPVETIDEGESIGLAIQRLADANVHGLVVVDGTWPIGVFTHTEAMHAHALPPMFMDTPVEGVMSYETICLDVDTPLYRAAGHFVQMRVRRILVVHDRELRGIVSGFDLVRAMVM